MKTITKNLDVIVIAAIIVSFVVAVVLVCVNATIVNLI